MAHVWYVAHHRLLPCSGGNIATTTSRWRKSSSRSCSFFFSGSVRATATSSPPPLSGSNGAPPLNTSETKKGPFIMEIPLDKIRRPLSRTRANDAQKVKDLMLSISEIGLQEPIDVLEVDGVYYGFSGCHRSRHTSVLACRLSVVKLEGAQEQPLGTICGNMLRLAERLAKQVIAS